jgi:hypothetical protein
LFILSSGMCTLYSKLCFNLYPILWVTTLFDSSPTFVPHEWKYHEKRVCYLQCKLSSYSWMRTLFFMIFSFEGGSDIGFESNKIVTCKIECEQCPHYRMRGRAWGFFGVRKINLINFNIRSILFRLKSSFGPPVFIIL